MRNESHRLKQKQKMKGDKRLQERKKVDNQRGYMHIGIAEIFENKGMGGKPQ